MDGETGTMLASGSLFAYLAGVLLVASAILTSVRAQRVFATMAGALALVFFAAYTDSRFGALLAAAFFVINIIQLAMFYGRARSGRMLSEEQALFDQVLQLDDPSQQGRLRDLMQWRTARVGEVLMEQGQVDPPLVYIASGAVDVSRGDKPVGLCGAGEFLGEMSLVSGASASASVTVREPSRIAVFDRDALGQYARAVPDVGASLNAALNRGLASKITRLNEAGHIDQDG